MLSPPGALFASRLLPSSPFHPLLRRDSLPPPEYPPPEPRAAMAENPGLENHRIKSFKNKGRDVEVSVLPRSGPSGLTRLPAPAPRWRGGAGGWRHSGSCRLEVGQNWPPPRSPRLRAGQSGRGNAASRRSCAREDQGMPGFLAPSRGRGLLSARKGCGAEAGSAGRSIGGRGC